jgi:hypothetical protein
MKELFNDNPFIKNLDKESIQSLIFDNKLRKNDVNIFFVVDTYDIIEYCFPFQAEDQTEAYELKTKLIAYEYLFYQSNNKPIVPDEYLAELNSFMYTLKDKAKNTINAFKDIEVLFQENTASDLKFDFFAKNITTFLAIQYDLLSPDSLKRYNDIYRNRLDMFDISIDNKNDKMVLSNLFLNIEKSELTNQIFEDYYDDIKFKFLKKSPTSEEVFRNLNNTYKDIIVIDRLIQINRLLEEKYSNKELEEKYLFLYVSSTPAKSKILFNLPSIKNNLPSIYGYDNFNFLRNAPQIYLQAISNFNTKEKEDDAINFFKQIIMGQERIDKIHEIELTMNKVDPELRITLAKNRFATRNQFDVVSKMQRFYENKDKLTKVIEDLKGNDKGVNSKSFRRFKRYLEKIVESNEFKTKSNQVFEYLHLHTANSEIQGKILEMRISDRNITPDFGEDSVRSNYQHLPILIFFRQQRILTKSNWTDLLRTISNYLTDPLNEEKKDFIEAYNKIINNLRNKKDISAIEGSIILYYLSLILPDPDSKVGGEEQLIKQLENLKHVIKYSSIKYIYKEESESFVEERVKSNYEHEINYMLIWVYRRKKNFEKSIELADKMLEKDKYDPRMLHGKALSILSRAYSDKDITNNDKVKELLIGESLLRKALNLYRNNELKDNLLVRKTIVAIVNSICNLYNHLYDITKENKFLIEAVLASKEFEVNFKNNVKRPIDSFPAFCDTLCWLNIHLSEFKIQTEDYIEGMAYYNSANKYFEICRESGVYDNYPDDNYYDNLKIKLRKLKKKVTRY